MKSAYVWFVRGEEHAAMCRTSIESVAKVDPNALFIVATDEPSPRWQLDAVVLNVAPGSPIMLANLEGQIQALSYAWAREYEQIVLIDTDTLVLKKLPCDGDINFTWRDHVLVSDDGEKIEGIAERMPYNYGVITARPSLVALECLIWLRERIRAMHPTHQQWYGNQLAAVELAGAAPKGGSEITERRIPWMLTKHGKSVRVGKIPCETYNYTPQSLDEDVSARHVLHFKGVKRHLMSAFAQKLGLGWYVLKVAA